MTSCPTCRAPLADGALFCEACGAKLSDAAPPHPLEPPADATDEQSPISVSTHVRRPAAAPVDPPPLPCTSCGGTVGPDGYCERCGLKAPSPRDHFREQPVPWVAGVCDRGIVHHRNEDAMALWAEGERAVLVVCDGVSTSIDSDIASLAGARAAREVLRAPMPRGAGTPQSADAAAAQVFTAAAAAANAAVVANTSPESPSPASCTFVVAVVEGMSLRHAVIGDSRAYWLPDDGPAVQLTIDDSMAQMLMAGGMPRAQAEASPQAHAITKWLGKDSPDVVPVCGSRELEGPGWVLVCSDGLWNYASEPEALAAQIAAAATSEPLALAAALVDFANAAGGRDNITATLARIPLGPGASAAAGASTPADEAAYGQDSPTEEREARG